MLNGKTSKCGFQIWPVGDGIDMVRFCFVSLLFNGIGIKRKLNGSSEKSFHRNKIFRSSLIVNDGIEMSAFFLTENDFVDAS